MGRHTGTTSSSLAPVTVAELAIGACARAHSTRNLVVSKAAREKEDGRDDFRSAINGGATFTAAGQGDPPLVYTEGSASHGSTVRAGDRSTRTTTAGQKDLFRPL